MLQAIPGAPLGDDVYGEDPAVNRLEELPPKRWKGEGPPRHQRHPRKSARKGDAAILEATSPVYLYEAGGRAVVGGLIANPIPGKMGP